MSATANHVQQDAQNTLHSLNQGLGRMSFPALDEASLALLTNQAPIDRIQEGANRALNGEMPAFDWLVRLFQNAGLLAATGTSQVETPTADPANQPASNETRNEAPSKSPAERISLHVYGGKAALTFESDITRGGEETVAIDAASSQGPRQYDWANKIRLQLTARELPIVTAVLLGMLPECEFKNHGPNNDKGFSLQRQLDKNGHFMRVFAADAPVRAVPIDAADSYRVTGIFMKQLMAQMPGLDGQAIDMMLRSTVKLYMGG